MPRTRPYRQPEPPLRWYGSAAGQGLLAVEQAAMARLLAASVVPSWAWFGVTGAPPPESDRHRGLRLRRTERGFDGELRCALPLPIASESLGVVLVQHALDDGTDPVEMLEECMRVLVPGGVLWLATLNPWSPYRARWVRSGLHARAPGRWQASLRKAGFAVDSLSLQWLGPRWRSAHGDSGVSAADRLRAGIGLTVNKRVHAAIPARPLRRLRLHAVGRAQHRRADHCDGDSP